MGDKNYDLYESISLNYHLSQGSLYKKTVSMVSFILKNKLFFATIKKKHYLCTFK